MSSKFALTREVLAEAARTGRPEITRRDEVEAAFGGVEPFLLALHHRWRTALFARLDALIEDPPDDFEGAVAAVWADPALGGRGLRALLDAHAHVPALAAAQERERSLVRRTLGVELPERGSRPACHGWRRGAA
ncbi:MAG TPA: hypothetical protein VKZ81_03320 [Pseudonocardia sp.]|jgi:hypothetical protein|uniref:hypothetical protein n=1 Tax=Pseudonocardia sp. TaxID=60912 RepID=UPI002B4AC249|nr:hypothetical protein [Pseudonocardia sp.]HLU54467.1 hypothetical protein [Pseudonocardia sp.]